MREFDQIHSFLCRAQRWELSAWTPHLGFVPQAWGSWPWVRTPLGTKRTNLQASSGGHCWGHSSAVSLRAFEFPLECRMPLAVGSRDHQAVQSFYLDSPGMVLMTMEQAWLKEV